MEKRDYSRDIRISQEDILAVAQQYTSDTPLEVAEIVWSELADGPEEMPVEMANYFSTCRAWCLGSLL